MAFSDPQSLTVNSVANSLPRTAFGDNTGAFTSADGALKLSISHRYGKRNRSEVRVDSTKVTADPFVPNVNQKVGASVYMVIDRPVNGYTTTELKQIADALVAYLSASTGANITRVLGGEI
jgi:hypothetical protein